ncbi:AraC family transcriptional regulator [Ruminococcaceae bacterium OttesenSCG-928-D13]|nr:AraC family transcriptional regulator [Ruminococcaceae bacterium OttesenSCG-928-D13]
MDIIKVSNSCAMFYRASGLSVSCHDEDGTCVATYPLMPTRMTVIEWPKVLFEKNPDILFSPSQAAYGVIRLKAGGYVTVGPAYNVPVTKELVSDFMKESYIPHEQWGDAETLLGSTPMVSLLSFMDKLVFLHYILNDEIIDPWEHFSAKDLSKMPEIHKSHLEQTIEVKEEQAFHNTFQWEQQFYQLIKAGSPEKMALFLELNNSTQLMQGTMADTPLRQAKNIFIGAVTKIGVLGAIPGGMDVEQAYQLIDSYAQECERAQTISEIDRLHYTMVMDFCRRVAASRLPRGISREVFSCIGFIKAHTNENINVHDVAQHIQRSDSYTLKKFKQETGINMGEYITQCKLEEAQDLLAYTQKSLAEISSYLCFSSQSYFQNVFKKKYGVTPMQYRKQHHIA